MSLHEAMDRLFNESVVPSQGQGADGSIALPVNVREEKDAYVITAALPGVRPEDIQIEATANTITIAGETSDEREVDEGEYVRRERRFGRFFRLLELPVELDADEAEASFEHGVLTLRVPKSEATKPKQVQVKSQGSQQQLAGKSQQSQQPQSQQAKADAGQQPKRESGNGRDTGSKQETREPVSAAGKGSGGSGAAG
ncbi:MAG: Hsp20/alpha crystallin family protein, partial [Chloroflexi bacterium]